jgi:hypothetical protein
MALLWSALQVIRQISKGRIILSEMRPFKYEMSAASALVHWIIKDLIN